MSESIKTNLSIEVWRELENTFESIEKSHTKRVKHLKLTGPQFSVLEVLKAEGKMPLRDIGKSLNVTGANITCVMDNLQKRNYAIRIPSKEDRRIINAELTSEGKRIIEEYTPEYAQSISGELKNLSDDEKKSLLDLLTKIRG